MKMAVLTVIFLVLFFFRFGIFNTFSVVSLTIFHPFLVLGDNIGTKFKNLGAYFSSKNSLYQENQNLHAELTANETQMINYNSIVAENVSLKDILSRKTDKVNFILGAILSKPNQSPYDTLIIDAGINDGVRTGNMVFASGDVPIGKVDAVYMNSSKIILFSSAGEKTEGVVGSKNVFMELVGRGGGNFEMIMPKDFTLQSGDQVLLPGINPYVLATVEKVISDPRDPFTKALLRTPVNIEELKFVEILR